VKGLFITPHALQRLREHWPELLGESDGHIVRIVKPRLRKALEDGKKVNTPGGTYVPLSVEGRDGFAVLHGLQVVTVQPKERCLEILEQGDFF
jgi:hypothetical protein